MRLAFPKLQTRITLLSISASLILTGAAVSSYGLAPVHDYPEWLLGHPLFPVLLILFGLGGVIIYLSGVFIRQTASEKIFKLLLYSPLIFFALLLSLNGKPMTIAWSVSTAIAGFFVIFSDTPGQEDGHNDLLSLYGYLTLVLFGILSLLLMPMKGPVAILMGAISLASGVLGFAARGLRLGKANSAIHVLSGLMLLVVAGYGLLAGHALIHSLLILPLGLGLVFYRFIRPIRFARTEPGSGSTETRRVRRFQDVTELNAWAVYVFAIIHVFIEGDLGGDILFGLFVFAFVSFVYQYRYKSADEIGYRHFHFNTIKNLLILTVVGHLTGGIQSPFNAFFFLTILSTVVGGRSRQLQIKLAIIGIYLVIESALGISSGTVTVREAADAFLLQYFIVIVAGLYIHRAVLVQSEIDEGLRMKNKEIAEVLEDEKETREIVSSQADELRQAREQLETVLRSVTDGIIAVDAKGEILFMNDAALMTLRLSTKMLESDSVADALPFRNENPDAPDVGALVAAILSGKKDFVHESYVSGESEDERVFWPLPDGIYLDSEDGKRRYFEGAFVDLGKDSGEVRMVVTFRDITYRKEIDELKTNFMSVAAHQLRTPLSSIRWYLELLNDPSEGKLKKNQKMFAENAYVSLRRMIDLVNGLLAVTRVESSRVPSNPEPISVTEMTDELLGEFRKTMKEKSISVHRKSDEEIPPVLLDPQLSREVFKNLISNAIRYSDEKGEIVITVTDDGNEVRWSISDDGIGIPLRQQDKVFEKFFRASNAASHESSGTGLGLYLVKFIVEQWKGRIWFESEEGKGSTFHVTIPHEGMQQKKGEVSLHA